MTAELLTHFTPAIKEIHLLPSGGGRFEVMIGDEIIFSKQALGRHAEPGEIARLFQDKTGATPTAQD